MCKHLNFKNRTISIRIIIIRRQINKKNVTLFDKYLPFHRLNLYKERLEYFNCYRADHLELLYFLPVVMKMGLSYITWIDLRCSELTKLFLPVFIGMNVTPQIMKPESILYFHTNKDLNCLKCLKPKDLDLL